MSPSAFSIIPTFRPVLPLVVLVVVLLRYTVILCNTVRNRANVQHLLKLHTRAATLHIAHTELLHAVNHAVVDGRAGYTRVHCTCGCWWLCGSQGKTLTMCPRFIFEVNVRSRIYHINANAFLPSLCVRCGPLSILVLFAMKNGTRCGRNCKRERSTLYETIYGYLYSKWKHIYGIHNLLQRNMHYIIYYSICHNVTYTVMYIIKSGGKVVRNLICRV